MREIKFRAWSDSLKHMFYPEDNANEPNLWNLHPCIAGGTLISKKDYKLMQYTGLKDKNGKEIYEGDIIKYKYLHEDCVGTVRFDERLAHFNAYEYKHGEVIGNIYENPDLLEVNP